MTSNQTYSCTIAIGKISIGGKSGKVVCDTIRSIIKQIKGFKGQKGFTDTKLMNCTMFIRFKYRSQREKFYNILFNVLSDYALSKINIKRSYTTEENPERIKIRYAV
jgi:hypothetical protein